jgi:hypothetical protein
MNNEHEPKQFQVNFDVLIKDANFISSVEKRITDLIKSRSLRPIPGGGRVYRRNWYDSMEEQGLLNASFFINSYLQIKAKKSSLSSQFRHVIELICDQCANETLENYFKQLKLNIPKPEPSEENLNTKP